MPKLTTYWRSSFKKLSNKLPNTVDRLIQHKHSLSLTLFYRRLSAAPYTSSKCWNTGSRADGYLTFQMFELAPMNEAVMSTKGRLGRSFPASAIGVDLKQARSAEFRTAVAQTLALLSHQPVAGMQPQVKRRVRWWTRTVTLRTRVWSPSFSMGS
jgi:hypothetical protein